MGNGPWRYLDVAVIQTETEKAFKVILESGMIHWIPKSLVNNASNFEAGDRDVTLDVAEFFCEENGIGEE